MPVFPIVDNQEDSMRNVRRYRVVVNVLALLLLFGATAPDGRAQEGDPLYLPLISQGGSPSNSGSNALPGERAAPVTEAIPPAENDAASQPASPDGRRC
jgi:hypothetical protein